MTARQLAEVLVKSLGVYCVVLAVQHAGPTVSMFVEVLVSDVGTSLWDAGPVVLAALPTTGLLVLLAWILIAKGERIASRMIAPGSVDESLHHERMDPLSAAFIIAGVILLAWYVPTQLASLLLMMWRQTFLANSDIYGAELIRRESATAIIQIAIYIAISVMLIARAERIRDLVVRLRGVAGNDENDKPES